jgi:hypothetical protein
MAFRLPVLRAMSVTLALTASLPSNPGARRPGPGPDPSVDEEPHDDR